jgi:hypothetical protein
VSQGTRGPQKAPWGAEASEPYRWPGGRAGLLGAVDVLDHGGVDPLTVSWELGEVHMRSGAVMWRARAQCTALSGPRHSSR